MTRRSGLGLAVAAAVVGLAVWWTLDHGPAEPDSRESGGPRGESQERDREELPRTYEHPLIPARAGSTLRYLVHGPGDVDVTMNLSLARVTRRAGRFVALWQGQMQAVTPGSAPTRIPISGERFAIPGRGAQEPWFGVGPALPATHIRDQTWLWPESLAPGDIIEGTARLEMAGAGVSVEMHRIHRVHEREQVSVGAGTFDTWRVEVTTDSRGGGQQGTERGVMWIAERAGMVRAVFGEGAAVQTYELTSWSP